MIKLIEEQQGKQTIIHLLNENYIITSNRQDDEETKISKYVISTPFYLVIIKMGFNEVVKFENYIFSGNATPSCGVTNVECGVNIISLELKDVAVYIHQDYYAKR